MQGQPSNSNDNSFGRNQQGPNASIHGSGAVMSLMGPTNPGDNPQNRMSYRQHLGEDHGWFPPSQEARVGMLNGQRAEPTFGNFFSLRRQVNAPNIDLNETYQGNGNMEYTIQNLAAGLGPQPFYPGEQEGNQTPPANESPNAVLISSGASDDHRTDLSSDGRRVPCKRRAPGDVPGQGSGSSSAQQQQAAGNSGWPLVNAANHRLELSNTPFTLGVNTGRMYNGIVLGVPATGAGNGLPNASATVAAGLAEIHPRNNRMRISENQNFPGSMSAAETVAYANNPGMRVPSHLSLPRGLFIHQEENPRNHPMGPMARMPNNMNLGNGNNNSPGNNNDSPSRNGNMNTSGIGFPWFSTNFDQPNPQRGMDVSVRGGRPLHMRGGVMPRAPSPAVAQPEFTPSSGPLTPAQRRGRMVHEVRNALALLRRSGSVHFQDVIMIDRAFLLGLTEEHDAHQDLRLDVDDMSYEELLALGDRIGNVSTGLSEEEILTHLRRRKYQSKAVPLVEPPEPCCVCQEDYADGEDLGKLDCGHDFHFNCIKQWLHQKNSCPICKMKGLAM